MSMLTLKYPQEYWLQYKTPVVRQLAFTLLSPNIITDIPSQLNILHAFQLHHSDQWQYHFENYKSRLAYLDLHPNELHDFLHRLKSTRLGLRFEMLMWFWLQDHLYHPYHLLGHSIQIIDGPRTVGELDFLLKNTETNEVEHWEVALKYYLGEKDLSLDHWYGLNRSDTLFRKMNHFTQKQFQFSNVMNNEIYHRFAVIKGQLFLPLHSEGLHLPSWINTNRRLGLWGDVFPDNHLQYHRLNRHEWLCPNLSNSSHPAQWWTDGLYLQSDESKYYMYRNIPPIKIIY